MDEVSDARQKVIDAARRVVAGDPLNKPIAFGAIFSGLREAVAELDGLQPPGSDAT